MNCDVAIIGGGPGGATVGTLLKQRQPDLDIHIFEKETFPRDHVGESLLPLVCGVLNEMGAWGKVEEANFPIKIGATFKWGQSEDLWDFEFLPGDQFTQQKRPGRFKGQRQMTAWQVDRAAYDEILLNHAAKSGVEVHQNCGVKSVAVSGDAVDGLVLENGETVTAKRYIDASGRHAILRRALDIEIEQPTQLQNVAFWDYWDNAKWAVELAGEGTRVSVISLPYGWLWFIPISKTRASVGLVIPKDHYKQMKLKPEEVYKKALADDPLISSRLSEATADGNVQGVNDWSFLSSRMYGENWALVGESAGFADPVLAAGLTLTQVGASELAAVLNEEAIGEADKDWLFESWEALQVRRVRQHIQFAEFWYSGNGQFSDLREFTQKIAADSGLDMTPEEAFRWLGTGGFINDDLGTAQVATYSVAGVKLLSRMFSGEKEDWLINKYNQFQLNTKGIERVEYPIYDNGRVIRQPALKRSEKLLPMAGMFGMIAGLVKSRTKMKQLHAQFMARFPDDAGYVRAIETLEAMVQEGWVTGTRDKKEPTFDVFLGEGTDTIHVNRDAFLDQR